MITGIFSDNVFRLFSVVVVVTVIVSCVQLRKIKKKNKEDSELILRQQEYDGFSKDSREAIVNTVISFDSESTDSISAVDKYIRTVNYGVMKMRTEGFNFGGVDIV